MNDHDALPIHQNLRRLRPGSVLVLLLSLVMLATGVAACSDSSSGNLSTTVPTATDMGGAATTSTDSATADTTSAVVDPLQWPMQASTVIDVSHEEVASAVISAQGGVLEYGAVKVDVPPGALAADTTISITRLTEPFHTEPMEDTGTEAVAAVPAGSAYDFGPPGVAFVRPVTITLPYDPGMGPNEVDPRQIAIAYWNGQAWVLAGGTANPENHTVEVQLQRFDGSVGMAVVVGTVIGGAVYGLIKWLSPEGTKSDPVSEGEAKDLVDPKDPVVQKQAAKAVLVNQKTREVRALDAPDLAAWVEDSVKSKQTPILAYKDGNEVVRTTYDQGSGSNWQKPSGFFTKGTTMRPSSETPGITLGGPLWGDCTDVTNASVSVLRAKGFAAKGVYGYGDGDKRRPHVWGEVRIGNRVYRIDNRGGLIAPENDGLDGEMHYKTYQPVSDPNDPHYNSMWDDEGQEPYDPMWFEAGEFADFAGTYDGVWFLAGFFKNKSIEVPVTFTVDKSGMVKGSLSWSGPTGAVHETQGVQTLTISGDFEGFVDEDGMLDADGPSTFVIDPVIGKGGTSSSAARFPLEGQISKDGTFRGSVGGDESQVVTAQRQ